MKFVRFALGPVGEVKYVRHFKFFMPGGHIQTFGAPVQTELA